MIAAATGHRPEKLGGYDNRTSLALGGLATEWLAFNLDVEEMIVGMALGWDQAVAGACVATGVPFIAAVPFEGQSSTWPAEARAKYDRLLAQAKEIVIVTPGELFGRQIAAAMQRRNEWMVDRAKKVVALWDGSWGGTHNCIMYANKIGVPVENLWPRWSQPEDMRALLS